MVEIVSRVVVLDTAAVPKESSRPDSFRFLGAPSCVKASISRKGAKTQRAQNEGTYNVLLGHAYKPAVRAPLWLTIGFMLTLCGGPPLLAQVKASADVAKSSIVSVPFVGCASSGQVETLDAPRGTSRSLELIPKHASALAYYQSADGIGVLAPRGGIARAFPGPVASPCS
jgi:hypothetical protein